MKTYTYRVVCSFVLQHSFAESEVGDESDGGRSDLAPTDAALAALKEEIETTLGQSHAIASFDLHTDSDGLLGVDEDDDA